jgi:hypothetical protein
MIGLIDIDSKTPNLALMKISAYYKKQGELTELTYPLFAQNYDKCFASKIFTWTETPHFISDVEFGGSGVSLEKELPDEIENMRPDYDLYPDMDYSMGFITEGVVLVNNATETNWFNNLSDGAAAVCFPRGRIKFIDKNGEPSGAPLQGQAILYFGENASSFADEFGEFGRVFYAR